MLISRPLPSRDGGTPIIHIHELVRADGAGSEVAPVSKLLRKLSKGEFLDMYARFERLESFAFFQERLWPERGSWFKHLRNVGDVWELGNDDRVRFYGFRDGNSLLLTNGDKKSGAKTPIAAVKECMAIRDEFKRQPRGTS